MKIYISPVVNNIEELIAWLDYLDNVSRNINKLLIPVHYNGVPEDENFNSSNALIPPHDYPCIVVSTGPITSTVQTSVFTTEVQFFHRYITKIDVTPLISQCVSQEDMGLKNEL